MAKALATQQELSPEAAEAIAQYQIDIDAWRSTRRRQIAGIISVAVIQVPLFWLSAIAASAVHMSEAWASFFSIAMFLGAAIFGIIFIVAASTVIFDTPPRRPSIIGLGK